MVINFLMKNVVETNVEAIFMFMRSAWKSYDFNKIFKIKAKYRLIHPSIHMVVHAAAIPPQ